MEKSRFFESKEVDGLDDRIYTSPEFAEFYETFLANGVFAEPADGLLVSPRNGFDIEVAAGCAMINGYWYENTDPFTLIIDPIDELARIDLVILRLDLNDEERKIHLDVLKGKLSSMPVDPIITQTEKIYDIVIARVRLDYGISAITPERIIDTRRDDNYCGVAGAYVSFDEVEMQNQIKGIKEGLEEVAVPGIKRTYDSNVVKVKIVDYRIAGTYQWTVPAGVYYVDVFMMGGGGGAPYATSSSGADCGGGGAGYVKNIIKMAVTPGQKIALVVGAGGKAGTSSSQAAGAGGTSSFNGITAAGGEAGSSMTAFSSTSLNGRPGAGSSAGGSSGGGGSTYASGMYQSSHTYLYVQGQGHAAMNVNDPGVRYGRGGKSSDGATPSCDIQVGNGGDGGRTTNGTINGTAGTAGCVIIYAHLSIETSPKNECFTTSWLTVNQYLVTIPNQSGDEEGSVFRIRFHAQNTSTVTYLGVNGKGVLRLYHGSSGTTDPAVGLITQDLVWLVQYSMGSYRLLEHSWE